MGSGGGGAVIPASQLDWWLKTDAGLWARIGLGALIFLALALWDWRKRGRQATRWREYLFLLLAVVAAMGYGVVNDQLTVTISWEYYYWGKGVGEKLGLPVDPWSLRWEALKIGLKATWSAGLLVGVALLLASNPRAGWGRVSYGRLMRGLIEVFVCAAILAMLLGVIGYAGGFVPFSSDFAEMVRRDEFRPYRFMAVFGVHLGGYVGGLIGTIVVVVRIVRQRMRQGTLANIRTEAA